jgi:hypothetical protein
MIAAILCLVPAALALAGDLSFDGKRATVALESVSDHFTGADVASIRLTVAPSWQPDDATVDPTHAEPDATLFQLSAVNDALVLSVGERAGVLSLSNSLPVDPLDLQLDPKAGRAATLEIALQSDQTWAVRVDGKPAGSLAKGYFAPAAHDRLHLQLGGPGFVGRIDGFEIRGPSGQPVVAVDAAARLELAHPFTPQLGSYFLVDSLRNIPAKLAIAGLDQHGLFEREPYFALVRRNGELGLVFDWGGYLALVPDQAEPNVLVPKNPAEAWAGRLRFLKDPTGTFSQTVFSAEQVNARPGVPFLQNGKRYQRIEDRQNVVSQTPVGQKLGEVWATDQLPSNFQFSQEGCFDVTTMDLANLQHTGCRSSLFEYPPIASSDYSTPDKKVVPSGWRYESYRDFVGGFTSSIATSSDEIEDLRSGGSSAGLNIMGIKAHHNSSVEKTRGQTIEQETSVSLHQFSTSSFATILNPLKVYLNHCFIRHVARAVPGAALPSYFSPSVTEKYGYDDRIGEACPEELWLPLADAGTAKTEMLAANAENLIELHSTHYAYAITYGARGEQQTTFSKSALATLASNKTNVEDGIGLEIQQKIKGVPVNASGSFDQTSGSAASAKLNATSGVNQTSYQCVGGSSCTEGKPDIGDAAIPIYLHLRPLDELLAPPYFDDPEIVVDFRQAVRAALARKLQTTPATDPTSIRLVRITVDSVQCAKDQWWLGGLLCHGEALARMRLSMALAVYGIHADGTAEFLGDTPIIVPLATAANGFVVPVVLNPTRGKEVVKVGFRLVPAGYKPATAEQMASCGTPGCQKLGVTVVKDNLTPVLAYVSAYVVSPGYRAVVLEPDFVGVNPRDLLYNLPSVLKSTRALSLSRPPGDYYQDLDVNVTATFELLDPAATLGFPALGRAGAQPPAFEPAALSDAAPEAAQPDASGSSGIVTFFNQSGYVAEFTVVFVQAGQAVRLPTGRMTLGQRRSVALPADATGIVVVGDAVGAVGNPRFLEAPLPHPRGETCFKSYGTVFRPAWDNAC